MAHGQIGTFGREGKAWLKIGILFAVNQIVGDDRRCSCSAATAEDAKFMMAQNEKDREREGDGLDAKSGTQ